MKEEFLPSKVDWPERRVDWNIWIIIFSILSLGAGVALAGITTINIATKVGIILISSVLPILLQFAGKYSIAIADILIRYEQTYRYADRLTRSYENTQLQFGRIMHMTLAIASLDAYTVTNMTKRGAALLPVISTDGIASPTLCINKEVLLFDKFNYTTLGRFRIIEETRWGFLAEQTDEINAIWWGKLHQMADQQTPMQLNIIAIVLPQP